MGGARRARRGSARGKAAARPATQTGSRALRLALKRAGYRISSRPGHYPLLVVDTARGQRRRRRYAVYLLTGEPVETGAGLERRVGFRRGRESWGPPPPDAAPLVFAYSPRNRVFLVSHATDLEEGGPQGLSSVSDRWLQETPSSGLQLADADPWVACFTGDRISVAIRLAEVVERTMTLSPSAAPPTPEEPRRRIQRRRRAPVTSRKRRVVLDSVSPSFRRGPRQGVSPPARLKPAKRGPVETGFSTPRRPHGDLARGTPLKPGASYFFWLAVGTDSGASIEEEDVTLPEKLPNGASLTVRVTTFEGEIELDGPDQGEIEVADSGARVLRPATKPQGDPELASRRLLFRVRAPLRAGTYRLRCSIYYGSTLVQSRLVRARVGPGAGRALSSRLDYRVTGRLSPDRLATVPSHDLSLLVNGDGQSHQFHFFRAGERGAAFSESSSLSAENLDATIEQGREALREVAWGSANEWDGDVDSYRYKRTPTPARFVEDLAELARAGAALYTEIADQLAGGIDRREELEQFAAFPGRVQIVAPSSLYVPVGLFYDHPIHDVPPKGSRFSLCPDFAAAIAGRQSLEQSACMTTGCKHRAEESVVCPSGFWGFRHELGWPPSADESSAEISHMGNPSVVIGVSTDRNLKQRANHVTTIKRQLKPTSTDLEVAESLDSLTLALKKRSLNLVYMYCHGGMEGRIPYVELGKPGSGGLTRNYLRNHRPWAPPPPRSVVFINGCHTTKVGPSQVLNLVSGFVEEAGAAGVIGTELTVFEPLACAFAEHMLPGFVDGERTVGGAVRHARLELLRTRNPLGLVYVPFIAAGTRLVKQS